VTGPQAMPRPSAAPRPCVYLLRHGATEWSENGRHTGATELPLLSSGVADAERLAPVLAERTFALVASSPRARALETCRLAGLADRAEVWDELAEWDYGDYEGITTADIQGDRPGWELFRDGTPGGESPATVSARADAVIRRLLAVEGEVALFSHGHFLRVLGARWAELPVEAGLRLLLDTGTVSVLDWKRSDRVIGQWNAPVADPV
jgi:broad specificity phosphatase PhoE